MTGLNPVYEYGLGHPPAMVKGRQMRIIGPRILKRSDSQATTTVFQPPKHQLLKTAEICRELPVRTAAGT